MNKHYQVAGHTMAVSMSPSLCLSLAKRLSHYEPFAIPTDASTDPLFHLEVTTTDKMPDALEVEWRQDEEGQEIICGHIGTHPAFVFRWWGVTGGILTCSTDYREATLQLFTGKPGQSGTFAYFTVTEVTWGCIPLYQYRKPSTSIWSPTCRPVTVLYTSVPSPQR